MNKIEDPTLPRDYGNTVAWVGQFTQWCGGYLRRIVALLNASAEGRIGGAITASTAAPTGGTWAAGDYIRNTAPTEAGSAGSKYVIVGWVYNGSAWLECRALTGN